MDKHYLPGFLADINCVEYTNELAAKDSSVGGGSASAMALALAAGCAAKVASIMAQRPCGLTQDEWDSVVDELNDLRYHALVLAEDDVRALFDLKALWKKDGTIYSKKEKVELIQAAMTPAKQVIEISELICEILESTLLPHSSKIVLSDVGVAALLLDSAANSALLNVQINHSLLMNELDHDKQMDAELDFSVSANACQRISLRAREVSRQVQEKL